MTNTNTCAALATKESGQTSCALLWNSPL